MARTLRPLEDRQRSFDLSGLIIIGIAALAIVFLWTQATPVSPGVAEPRVETAPATDTVNAVTAAEPVARQNPAEVAPPPTATYDGPAEFAVENGYFFTQTAAEPGHGYAVTNQDSVPFWDEFQRLGGVAWVGYPISNRFEWNGLQTQAFQKMILQWQPELGRVAAVNVMDVLHDREMDQWLFDTYGVPAMADWSSDAGQPWPRVAEAHLALLTDPEIRAAYEGVADPLALYGLPMAPPAQSGDALMLRTQRTVLQKWLNDTPWATAGQVTTANSGDIAKDAGLLPAEGLQAQPVPENQQ